jgi:hypothetical protein
MYYATQSGELLLHKTVLFNVVGGEDLVNGFFLKDLLQRKYVQHVRGQVTELFQ